MVFNKYIMSAFSVSDRSFTPDISPHSISDIPLEIHAEECIGCLSHVVLLSKCINQVVWVTRSDHG